MALPRSTFVMGLLTLGLFGLAIRSTIKHGDTPARDRDDDGLADDTEPDDTALLVQQEATDRARAEADRVDSEREILALQASMRQLYGAESASPGTLFEGLTLDDLADTIPDAVQARVNTFAQATDSSVELGGGVGHARIDQIEIVPSSDGESVTRSKVCVQLGTNLTEAWGHGISIDRDEVTVWLNRTTHTRAMFKPGIRCTLTFDRYVDAGQWVARTPASVIPLSMIGQPATKAAAAVGAELEDDSFEWHGPGVGAGTSGTDLTATVVGGKVVLVAAVTYVAPGVRADVQAQLTKLGGKPTTSDDADLLTWKGRPPISFEVRDGGRLVLVLGKAPN